MEPTKIVEQFQKHFYKLLNSSSTNGNIVKYERLIYQTVEPEMTETELEEIVFIYQSKS